MITIGILGRGKPSWWQEVAMTNFVLMFFLGFAVRAWAFIALSEWIWIALLLPIYIFAWSMPALLPKASALLFREQYAPETRYGRGCMTIMLIMLPAAGGLGAVFGLHASRSGQEIPAFFLIASLSSAVAVGWGQAAAHRLWPNRPWALEAESDKQEAGS
jgi:hypothetical protein